MWNSEVDEKQCMQAGRDGPPQDGERLRMFRCDPDNELQRLVFDGVVFQPAADKSLCVVWQGVTPNVGSDNIILKKCDKVEDRTNWSPSRKLRGV
jgi:hypothetical protein